MITYLSKTYAVDKLCSLFRYPRSSFYYQTKLRKRISRYDMIVKDIFYKNHKVYGARKMRFKLAKLGFMVSRRKILEIMKYLDLVPKYVKIRRIKFKTGANSFNYRNLVCRCFNDRKPYEVIAADVTYVFFGKKRYYLCILMDIATRMIVGTSVSLEIGSKLVKDAMFSMKLDFNKVQIFHTDRGSEFNNLNINTFFEKNGIKRSLSDVSSPLDNAIVESLNNIVKIEWQFETQINSISEFKVSWAKYVDWYNNLRIHGSLGYQTPAEYKINLDKTG